MESVELDGKIVKHRHRDERAETARYTCMEPSRPFIVSLGVGALGSRSMRIRTRRRYYGVVLAYQVEAPFPGRYK